MVDQAKDIPDFTALLEEWLLTPESKNTVKVVGGMHFNEEDIQELKKLDSDQLKELHEEMKAHKEESSDANAYMRDLLKIITTGDEQKDMLNLELIVQS